MCLLGAESQVWAEGWEDMPVLCWHTEESLHNETRSEIRHFIACSKSMIISSGTTESAYLLFKFLLHTQRLAYTGNQKDVRSKE
jgi:hypothetical protein